MWWTLLPMYDAFVTWWLARGCGACRPVHIRSWLDGKSWPRKGCYAPCAVATSRAVARSTQGGSWSILAEVAAVATCSERSVAGRDFAQMRVLNHIIGHVRLGGSPTLLHAWPTQRLNQSQAKLALAGDSIYPVSAPRTDDWYARGTVLLPGSTAVYYQYI